MSNVTNEMCLLTAPGEGALQIYELKNPSSELITLIEQHFSSKKLKSSVLRLGLLKDERGEFLDELYLEIHPGRILFHLHGGAMSVYRLKSQLSNWGCVEHGGHMPSGFEEECEWALEKALSPEATQVAMKNLTLLPNAHSSKELLDSFAYGHSLYNPTHYYMVGQSNAGKSSLINRMVQQERLVVDATAGTTRDLIEVPCIIGHRPCHSRGCRRPQRHR